MSGKLTGNGMWESSRMMLPEHKEAINYRAYAQTLRNRTSLDEQETEIIGHIMQQSLVCRQPVTIRMYDPREQLRVIGAVERIDRQLGRFRVDGEWFNLSDIEAVEIDT